jgi:hypothetical protein
MIEPPMTVGELREQWREAARAAELADRLAHEATESVTQLQKDARSAAEIADMAERVAQYAERAAVSARQAANRAAELVAESRGAKWVDAQETAFTARADEETARRRYKEARRGEDSTPHET